MKSKASGRRKDYFDINLLSARHSRENTVSPEPDGPEAELPWYSKLWDKMKSFLLEFVDNFTLLLEDSSALYLQVVKAVGTITPPVTTVETEAVDGDAKDVGGAGGASVDVLNEGDKPMDNESVKRKEEKPQKKSKTKKRFGLLRRANSRKHEVQVVVEESPEPPVTQPAPHQDAPPESPAATTPDVPPGVRHFDNRQDILEKELHIRPSEETQKKTDEYQEKLVGQASVYTQKVFRLLKALYEVFLSHSEYVAYFLIILNIILNGGVVGLIFAVLLFGWGLLSNPWPTRAFWLTLIFYSMLVLITKYAFQIAVVIVQDNDNHDFTPLGGINWYTVAGIQFRDNFLSNAAWDMVLLIALLIHRGLLKVCVCVCVCVF